MEDQQLWSALQDALARSRLAGCSLEADACYLFFNENPLGEPLCLGFQPEAEVSLWLWQAETSGARVWGTLSNGQDSALPVLGCRLNQPEVWPTAWGKARAAEVLCGRHPAQRASRPGPQILLHMQPAMLAVHAAEMQVLTRDQQWTLEQLSQRLSACGMLDPATPVEAVEAFNKGQHLVDQQRYQEAIDTCQAVTHVWTSASKLHLTLGQAFLGLREWTQAEEEFSKAVRLAPDSGEAWFGLAEAREGGRRPCQEAFSQAAHHLAAAGKLDLASEALRRAQAAPS